MEFHYNRDEKTGLYNASISCGHEHATFTTQADATKIYWTSSDTVGQSHEAIQHSFGEPDPFQAGYLHPISRGSGEWTLPYELRGKRSPKTILGVIATQPEAIHSVMTMHGTTEVNWYKYKNDESWPAAERHSMLGLQSARPLGESALRALFFATASEQLRLHSDDIFQQLTPGDFWVNEQSEILQVNSEAVSLHSAA